MFTGLIERKGILESRRKNNGGWTLRIKCEMWKDDLVELGESIAVQGTCLTVTEIFPDGFTADLLDETLRRTALGDLALGASVNLERALRFGDRLGGHIVSGHVDETGRLLSIAMEGRDRVLTVSCSREFSLQCVMKGSVTLNGVSLTITGLTDTSVSVNIIPHTWQETSLQELDAGSPVNLEADIIGKFIARRMEAQKSEVTEETLIKAGFINA